MDDKPEISRCKWVGAYPPMIDFHDREWGVPVYDDRLLWEYLVLDVFQAGLSWLTMIQKRENFRKALNGFDFEQNARLTDHEIDLLMTDAGIIRNRMKLEAIRNNAQAFIRIREEKGSFATYLWDFVDGRPIVNHWEHPEQIAARTNLSDKISRDLKKWGFRFTGSVMVYAFIQGSGLVNDHLVSCFRYHQIIERYGNRGQ